MVETLILDFDLNDDELKYNLIRIIYERENDKGVSPFECSGDLQRVHNLDNYIPIEKRRYFLLYNDNNQAIFKKRLLSLLQELINDGWVIKGTPKGESFYGLTSNGKEKFQKGEFNDWKQITSNLIETVLPLLPNDLLKEYFKEAWVCYHNQRLKIAPIFLLGAVSEGIIMHLLQEYEQFVIKNSLPSFSLSNGIARDFSKFLLHFETNNVKKEIKKTTTLSKEDCNALNELENYCAFFFNIYRHSRNDTGHLKPIEITREMIKVYFVSFKRYIEYVSLIIMILNKKQ
ncbi:MAG: hypothetical protein WC254_00910 [Candidatus Woesearchaeota archaeon]|jgi:hypothetical protein